MAGTEDSVRRLAALEAENAALLCWCTPERCHAEVIRDRLERR